MKIAATICFCAAFLSELYGVWGLLQTAKKARTILLDGTHSLVDNHDGTTTINTSDDGLFAGEEVALRALATPHVAIAALAFGIVMGFAGNLLSL